MFLSTSNADLKVLRPNFMQRASEMKWEATLPYCCASGYSYHCDFSWEQMRQYIIWKEQNVTMSKLFYFLRGIPSGVDAYQSLWAIGRGNCFDSRFLPCPWEAHIPYWPHRGQGHPDCVLQPSPSIPSSRHSLFTCCPGDCTATKTTHCCVKNGNEMAYNPPNDHTKDRYSVNISVCD